MVEAAPAFHEDGVVGRSPRRGGVGVEPIELTSTRWAIEAAEVISVRSSFFDALPAGSAVLDSAVAMRDIPFFWNTPARQPESRPRVVAVDERP